MADDKFTEVQFLGKKIMVRRATFGRNLERMNTMDKLAKETPIAKDAPTGELVKNGFHCNTYPTIIACSSCSTGLPAEEQCYDALEEELDAWVDAAKKMNPNWFSSVVSQAKKEPTQIP